MYIPAINCTEFFRDEIEKSESDDDTDFFKDAFGMYD